MRPVRTHKFNGVLYDIELGLPSLDGICNAPGTTRPSLMTFQDPSTKRGFETIVHEAMHASLWSLTEADVDRSAREITGFLWRLGYRRARDGKKT